MPTSRCGTRVGVSPQAHPPPPNPASPVDAVEGQHQICLPPTAHPAQTMASTSPPLAAADKRPKLQHHHHLLPDDAGEDAEQPRTKKGTKSP